MERSQLPDGVFLPPMQMTAVEADACQNPGITYMALTARAAAHVVEAMKRNEI